MQDIKDAARAQEAVVPVAPEKPVFASTEDRKLIKGKDLMSAEEQDRKPLQILRVDDDAKSVAGRKTMLKGGETKNLHSEKEAPMAVEREKEKYPAGKKIEKEQRMESQEDHEVEMELNSILKKGPSMSTPTLGAMRELGISR